MLEVRFVKKRGFTCMGAHGSKVSLYLSSFFAVGGHLNKKTVLPAWELENSLEISATFFIAQNYENMKFPFGSTFEVFFLVFVHLKRGRGRAAGAVEDHMKCRTR